MRHCATVLAIALTAAVANAQETYTFKFKLDPDVGKTIHYRSKGTDAGTIKYFDEKDKLLAEVKREKTESDHRQTVLARDKDGKATKILRVYTKANETENGKTKTFSYEGRTLLMEKVDGKWRIGVIGEANLADKDVEKLLKDLNKKKSESEGILGNLNPGKPVKIGESWKMPVKAIVESFDEMEADLEKSSAKAKLVGVSKKGNSQIGKFEVEFDIHVTGSKEAEGEMKFTKPMTMSAKMDIAIAIDGSTTERSEAGAVTMKGEASITISGQKMRVEMDMAGKGSDEHSAEIDDPKARVVPKVAYMPAPGEWTVASIKEFGFSAKFPGSPQKKAKNEKAAIKETEYSVTSKDGKLWYAVNVIDYPESSKIDRETGYANLKATPNLKESKDVKLDGLPAVELIQVVPTKAKSVTVFQRVLIIDRRMYQMLIAVEEGTKYDAEQFFSSFKLMEKPKLKPKDD